MGYASNETKNNTNDAAKIGAPKISINLLRIGNFLAKCKSKALNTSALVYETGIEFILVKIKKRLIYLLIEGPIIILVQ